MAKKKKKILLVEDDPMQIFMYKNELVKKGYNLFIAEDENKALKIAKNFQPDLILLDLLLGNYDGRNILKKLKTANETKKLTVVIFTNYHKQGIEKECSNLGAVGFILKSNFVPSEISKKVEEYIK